MKFSIVTPSYNQGRYIRDCIESVRMQTGVEWEHIVVDACSTDETLSIIKEYPHLQWVSEKDKGMSDGINKGWLKATGDWVMWLNTDDFLLEGTLESVARFANQQSSADVIYGDCLFVDEMKQPIRRKYEHPFDFWILLFFGCYIPSTSTFIRRSVITEGQLLDVDYRVCMDFEYYVRLHQVGYQFAYFPQALAGFRWHDTNTSTVHRQRRHEERLRVQRQALQRVGRGYLGASALLAVLYRVFQLKRFSRRWLGRLQGA